jgi:hypothetical protein
MEGACLLFHGDEVLAFELQGECINSDRTSALAQVMLSVVNLELDRIVTADEEGCDKR